MANIKIIQGGFEQKLMLQFAPGIKAGTPFFQLEQQFPNQKIVVFSSRVKIQRLVGVTL